MNDTIAPQEGNSLSTTNSMLPGNGLTSAQPAGADVNSSPQVLNAGQHGSMQDVPLPLPGFKAPDFLPDHLKADRPEDLVKLLADDWKRQREDISKRGAAPADVNGYKYDPSETVKPLVGDLTKDPVFNLFKSVAHKAGLPANQFETIMGGLYDQMAEKGLLSKTYSPVDEGKMLLGDRATGMNDAQIFEAIRPRIVQANDFVQAQTHNGTFDKVASEEILGLLDTARGVQAVEQIMRAMKTPSLIPGGDPAMSQGLTHAQLKERQRDPRGDINSAHYSKAFAEETIALYKKLF